MRTTRATSRRARVAVTLEQCWHRVPGGTAAAALGSVRALQTHGDPAGRLDLDLVGFAARHRAPAPEPWAPSIPVEQVWLPRLALYESWHRLRWPKVESVTGPVDVIHVTGMAMPPRSAPLVVTVNDLVFVHHPELFTRRGVAFFRRAIELTERDASLVICPSKATIADCEREGFDAQRLRLVPYGVELDQATGADIARARERYGIKGRYLLWLGTIEPRKNLPRLLKAFAQVSGDVKLVLAGSEGWSEDLERLAGSQGERVQRLGFVDERDKAALYAGADAFCLPSLLEGFGLPVLEALAQGTPVVTSAGTSTEELVAAGPDGGPAGLVVDPQDVGAIAESLQSIVDDSDRRAELGAAARRRAETYTWERTAAGLSCAYAEVLE